MIQPIRRRVLAQLHHTRVPQCRFYSSKPSSPADGANGDASAVRQALPTAASRSNRPSTRKNGNPNKSAPENNSNYPSVPSTHHIKSEDLAASVFFSLHRPLSVTTSFPKPVSEAAFAAIFTPRTQDASSFKETSAKLQAKMDSRLGLTSGEGAMGFPHHIMSGSYRPFNVPPAPVPMNTDESLAAGLEAAEEIEGQQHKTYTATLTIEESTDENGEVSYTAHSTPLELELPESEQSMYMARMQERRDNRARISGMWAISVKRQRKLKMKKHKYKKLMRKTRNLRRRLDRN